VASVVALSSREFQSGVSSSSGLVSAVAPTVGATFAVDHVFNGQQYMSWGPSRVGYNFQLGFNLQGSSKFSALLIGANDYTLLYYNNIFPKTYYTYYSLLDTTGGYLNPPYVGTGPSESCYFLIITRPSAPTTRVTGTVVWTVYAATNPNVTLDMAAPEIRSWQPKTLEVNPIGMTTFETKGNLKAYRNISIAPGERWLSNPVLKGEAAAMGYMINGTNRFNVLLMDKENLGKMDKREIFNYYPFYSRLDVFGAHLEAEAVLNLPADLYLVIFCVDAFQSVNVYGDILFESD